MESLISKLMADCVTSGGAVGASCLVFQNDKEIYSGIYGYADRENNIKLERNTIFRLFSLTKPITATAVMILVDMGLMSPEDEVSKFFSEYSRLNYISEYAKDGGEDTVSPCDEPLLISHLLTMTSGIPYANNWCESVRASANLFNDVISGQNGGEPVTTEEFSRRAAGIPLLWKPGEKWDYGISADILGGIVERVSGMKYGEFLKKYIFDPLGMNDTGFYVPEHKLGRFSALYKWENDTLVRDGDNYLGLTDYKSPPAFESGGAGLVSTIDDYSRFARMLCKGGVLDGVRIISSDSFKYMISPKLNEKQKIGLWDNLSGYNYACLMRIMTDESISKIKTSNGEFGWDGWTGTYFCADPQTDIVVLYFTQISGAGTTWQAQQIDRIVYDKLARNK